MTNGSHPRTENPGGKKSKRSFSPKVASSPADLFSKTLELPSKSQLSRSKPGDTSPTDFEVDSG